MSVEAPMIDPRDRERLLADLMARLPGYIPGWRPEDGSPGMALMQIFARYLEVFTEGLNRVPERSFLSFLDQAGMSLRPAQAARVPLVFSLLETSPVDVTLPANSQVAAPLTPAAPTASEPARDVPPQDGDLIFATDQTITLSRSRIAVFYEVQPGSDGYVDHSGQLTDGFTLFGDPQQAPHHIYLGHDHLFALAGDIQVFVIFTLSAGVGTSLTLRWEYLTETGWLPLESSAQDDTTNGMRRDGQFALRRSWGPDAMRATIHGRTSYWLRGRLDTPLPPQATGGSSTIPIVNDILARVEFSRRDLLPDAAFTDAVPLDTSKHFFPFGQQPARYTTFYLASRDVFQRKGGYVRIFIDLAQDGVIGLRPFSLAWEYHNGRTWSPLDVQPDATGNAPYEFTGSGKPAVRFLCPRDWAETSVNGVSNFWLRVRLTSGDYGGPPRLAPVTRTHINKVSSAGLTLTVDSTESFQAPATAWVEKDGAVALVTIAVIPTPGTLVLSEALSGTPDFTGGTIGPDRPVLQPATFRPPAIARLTLAYDYRTDPERVDHCVSYNDFVYADHSEAARWPDQAFAPITPASDHRPALHIGFDQPLPAGLLSLYADIDPTNTGDTSRGLALEWEYQSDTGWKQLGVLDGTQGVRHSGMIQFVGPPDMMPNPGFLKEPSAGTYLYRSEALYRIRARLKEGSRPSPRAISGLWMNAVWASQRNDRREETLGTSDGYPDQAFPVQRRPVLEDEVLEVREWTGRGDYRQTSVEGVTDEDLRREQDPMTGTVSSVWVTWNNRLHLHDSRPNDRHYMLDRATGLVRFGDGRRGRIPPAGSVITMAYTSGGGIAGNLPAGAISELHTAAPFVLGAFNPVPATGGADTERQSVILQRGPQLLRHRDRGITSTDLEWLARGASPEVAAARCLPLTGPDGYALRGWITVVVIPHGSDPRPLPSAGLLRKVREHLAQRMPAAIAGQVRVAGPSYEPVSVDAEIIPLQPDHAAHVESDVRANLNRFLHPLTGTLPGLGWDFGGTVHLSQVARVIEGTEGVDHARLIELRVGNRVYGDAVTLEAGSLVSAGDHELRLVVGDD